MLDEELPRGRAHEAFGPDGALRDHELRASLSGIVRLLVCEGTTAVERAA